MDRKITANRLRELWKKNNNRNGHLQVLVDAPLEWYIGHDAAGRPVLMILSDVEPAAFHSLKALKIDKGHRTDGRWSLVFTLTDPEQRPTFEKYSAHLINSSLGSPHAAQALEHVHREQKNWAHFLSFRASNENSSKGLLGELLFLQQLLPVYGAAASLEGWRGPLGADHDFELHDSWYEIKTTGAASGRVTITSLEQLNGVSSGMLVIQRLDKCSTQQPGALSLDKVVADIFAEIEDTPQAAALLETNLEFAEYDAGSAEAVQPYLFSARSAYTIDDSFPCLRRTAVPTAVAAASYELDIAAITPWKVNVEWMH